MASEQSTKSFSLQFLARGLDWMNHIVLFNWKCTD